MNKNRNMNRNGPGPENERSLAEQVADMESQLALMEGVLAGLQTFLDALGDSTVVLSPAASRALADLARRLAMVRGRDACPRCGEDKRPGDPCPGNDQCNEGPDGEAAQPCAGWGRYCCRCGADYARGQLP